MNHTELTINIWCSALGLCPSGVNQEQNPLGGSALKLQQVVIELLSNENTTLPLTHKRIPPDNNYF